MAYGLIYLVTNTVTGKVYVGQTTRTLADRWKSHRASGRKSRLGTSIRAHGKEAFRVEQLDTAESLEELNELERKYIAQYRSTDPTVGYNFEVGGAGVPRSRESVERGAAKLRGIPLAESIKEKLRATMLGRKQTPEHIAKVQAAREASGYRHSEESRAKMSAGAMGKKMPPPSEEHRAKLSAAAKADWARRKALREEQQGLPREAFLCPQGLNGTHGKR